MTDLRDLALGLDRTQRVQGGARVAPLASRQRGAQTFELRERHANMRSRAHRHADADTADVSRHHAATGDLPNRLDQQADAVVHEIGRRPGADVPHPRPRHAGLADRRDHGDRQAAGRHEQEPRSCGALPERRQEAAEPPDVGLGREQQQIDTVPCHRPLGAFQAMLELAGRKAARPGGGVSQGSAPAGVRSGVAVSRAPTAEGWTARP